MMRLMLHETVVEGDRDGRTITVTIPIKLVRRGVRKLVIAPEGSDTWSAGFTPRPDSALVQALAKAYRWKRMLEGGKVESIAALAKAEKVTRSYVCRLLRLTLLAPDLVEAALNGRQPIGLDLERLKGALPLDWAEQRAAFQ